jgi:hypothetical protein
MVGRTSWADSPADLTHFASANGQSSDWPGDRATRSGWTGNPAWNNLSSIARIWTSSSGPYSSVVSSAVIGVSCDGGTRVMRLALRRWAIKLNAQRTSTTTRF